MITFKPIEDKDQPFLEQLYRSTREKELDVTNWPEDMKHRFIIMQLMAQTADYKNRFKDATWQLILYKKKAAGRLYLGVTDHDIRIIDISLLPVYQGKGIGTKILKDIITSAHQKNKTVSLNVAHGNPAKKLYERLGFRKISESLTHELMECNPG